MLEIEKDIELSKQQHFRHKDLYRQRKLHFTFDTQDMILDSSVCVDTAGSQHQEEGFLLYCHDERIPVNLSQAKLWNFVSCSVDHQLHAFGLYDNFTRLMNSAPAKVTASLLKVDTHRPWFDETTFRDWEHFTMVSTTDCICLVMALPAHQRILT